MIASLQVKSHCYNNTGVPHLKLVIITGVQVLSKSLQATDTQYPLFVLTGPEVSKTVLSRLKPLCNGVIPGALIQNTYEGHEASWTSSEFLKLNIWNLTMFEQIVYLDADTLILESVDEVRSYLSFFFYLCPYFYLYLFVSFCVGA
jgi:hypothetical protein